MKATLLNGDPGTSEGPDDGSQRRVLLTALGVALLVLFGFVVRVGGIGRECPWYDEVLSIQQLDAPDVATFLERLKDTGTPITPVYFAIEYFWARMVGAGVTGLRMLSVLLGVLAIPAMYLLTRRFYDATAGLVAAFCLAASLVHIYYSQEIRMYAPVPLLALISVFALWQGLHKGGRRWWAVNVLCNALIAWTHMFAVMLPLVQGVFLLVWYRGKRRLLSYWLAAHAVLAAGYGLWARTLHLPRVYEAAGCIPGTSFRDFLMAFLIFAGGRASNENPRPHLPIHHSLDQVLAVFLFLLVAAFGVWTIHAAIRAKDRGRAEAFTLLALWLMLPPVLLFALSRACRPCFIYRYVLYSSLPLYILAGAAISTMRGRGARALLVCVLVCLYGYQLSALAVGPFRPDWRSVGRYVNQHCEPEDLILVYQGINTLALEFNADLPQEHVQTVEVWSGLCEPVLNAHREGRGVWLLVWLWADPGNFEACFEANGLAYTARDFASWPHVRVYHIAAAGAAARHDPRTNTNSAKPSIESR